MSHTTADATDDAAEDDSTPIDADVKDDDVRHDSPLDPALVRLAATTASSFTFDEGSATPPRQGRRSVRLPGWCC